MKLEQLLTKRFELIEEKYKPGKTGKKTELGATEIFEELDVDKTYRLEDEETTLLVRVHEHRVPYTRYWCDKGKHRPIVGGFLRDIVLKEQGVEVEKYNNGFPRGEIKTLDGKIEGEGRLYALKYKIYELVEAPWYGLMLDNNPNLEELRLQK